MGTFVRNKKNSDNSYKIIDFIFLAKHLNQKFFLKMAILLKPIHLVGHNFET